MEAIDVIDQDVVRAELERLARGETVPSWGWQRTIERAVAAGEDVEAAAAFAADVGCDRLADATEAAEHAGEATRAAEGRAVLAAFRRFEAACRADGDPRSANPDTDGVAGARPEPLPMRSRKPLPSRSREPLPPRSRNP